jgi:hypothetical protein
MSRGQMIMNVGSKCNNNKLLRESWDKYACAGLLCCPFSSNFTKRSWRHLSSNTGLQRYNMKPAKQITKLICIHFTVHILTKTAVLASVSINLLILYHWI